MIITTTENAFTLQGKNAIVTGGNKGIGQGIATAYAEQGCNVAIVARDAKSGEQVVADLSARFPSGKFGFYKGDLSSTESCREAVEQILNDYQEIDILVNNAGVGPNGDLLDMDAEISDYFKCINVDLNGVVRMTYLVGRHMRARGKGGKIVNISSNAGVVASRAVNMASYCTAKAAVNMFTKAMALELAKYGITVNAIAPGYTYSNLLNDLPQETIDGIARSIPTGRLGTAIEIGALAVYLASEAANQVTGTVVTIDGGHSVGIF